MIIARRGASQWWASHSTECRGNNNSASARLHTAAARQAASAAFNIHPVAHNAVNRARCHVARLRFPQWWALRSAKCGLADNQPVAKLGAIGAAGLRAHVEVRPGANNTVNRTRERVACLGLGQSRTGLAAKGWLCHNSAGASASATTAGQAAVAVGGPGSNNTVHGAFLRVASQGFLKSRASLTTKLG